MKKLVKIRANGEDHFAMWSSVVWGITTDYMPRKAMARWLHRNYPSISKDAVAAALASAIDPEEVGC